MHEDGRLVGRVFLYRLSIVCVTALPCLLICTAGTAIIGLCSMAARSCSKTHSSSHSPRVETNQRSRTCCPVNRASNDKRMNRLLFKYGMGQGNKRHASCRRRRLSYRAKPITEVGPHPALRGAAQIGGLRGVRINRPHMILVLVRLYMSWIKYSFCDESLPSMLEMHRRAGGEREQA